MRRWSGPSPASSSYGLVAPLAQKIKLVREARCRLYIIVKQTLLAFMNGALPQIAIEHGRKMIGPGERPSVDVVENETIAAAALKNARCRTGSESWSEGLVCRK